MGMHQYIRSLSDLENIIRCPGKFKYEKHSVASHSFKVTQIAQFLGNVEEQEGVTIDWRSLYERALNHDYTELFIGDIKTPVKYATPALRAMLADVEESMMANFVQNEIPERFQPAYMNLLKEGKDNTIEGKILSVADKVDLLYESYGEIQRGNPEVTFMEMYEESLKTIMQFSDMPSVQYFLREVLPELLAEDGANKDKLQKITQAIIKIEKI